MFRRIRYTALAAVLATGVAACSEDEGPDPERFTADLSGLNEVPSRTTPATGSAQFTVNRDNTIDYVINVSNLRNVTAAHIHGPGAQGVNAGIIVGLFSSATPVPGPTTGELARGTITTGSQAISLDSMLVLMRNGNAYVNVHTNDNVAPTNTGPGDFPGGELRGQIMKR